MSTIFRTILLAGVLSILLTPEISSTSQQNKDEPRSPAEIRDLSESDPAELYLYTGHPDSTEIEKMQVQAPPEGNHLVFESLRYDQMNLYRIKPDGSEETQVTELYDNYNPALSWNGNTIAYVKETPWTHGIFTIHADGTGDIQRSSSEASDILPAWSPDGSQIVFQSNRSGQYQIYVMNTDGSALRRITNEGTYNGQAAWSPDGGKIAFVSERDGTLDIWTMNPDGSNQERLTYLGVALQPDWSPDGKYLAYAGDKNWDGFLELWVMNQDGTGHKMLSYQTYATDYWYPAWSPDGKYLSYTQTSWTEFQDKWYWIKSYLMLLGPLPYGQWTKISTDDRVWKSDWAADDTLPPGPCSVEVPAQYYWREVPIAMEAIDQGSAGIVAYDLEVRDDPLSNWETYELWNPEGGSVFLGQEAGSYQFRCRAHDASGHSSDWTSSPTVSTTIDAARPASRISIIPKRVRADQVLVNWDGNDVGSGIQSYNVWLKEGTTGDWQVWKEDVTGTSAIFTGETGHRYYFNSQARDKVNHTQPWDSTPQDSVFLFTDVLTVSVVDVRGHAIQDEHIDIRPAEAEVEQQISGDITTFYFDSSSYTMTTTAPGYASLPETFYSAEEDRSIDSVLPAQDDRMVNGGFETGTLEGWHGSSSTNLVQDYHSGSFALRLDAPVSVTTTLSQTIFISETLNYPTLSFFYQIPEELVGGRFSITAGEITPTVVFSTSSATLGWLNISLDMNFFLGQDITLTFSLDSASGYVLVDEISLSSWSTPVVSNVTLGSRRVGQPISLTIEGENFISTPSIFLSGMQLSDVNWISATQLIAKVPENTSGGTYWLKVVNPGGAKGVLDEPLKISPSPLYLALITRHYDGSVESNGADWPTLGQNIAHTGYQKGEGGASRYSQVWTFDLGYHDCWQPMQVVVADGILVAYNNDCVSRGGFIVVIDAETGQELWRQTISYYSVHMPSIGNGSVYYVENLFEQAFLLSRDLRTGDLNWKTEISPHSSTHYPVVVNDHIIVNDGETNSYLSIFNAANGSMEYTNYIDKYKLLWVPSFANDTIYSWVNGNFYIHTPTTGGILSSLIIEDYWGSFLFAPPIISGDSATVFSEYQVRAIDLDAGNIRWSVNGLFRFGMLTQPAVADGVIYIINDNKLEARLLTTGQLLWTFVGDSELYFSPLVTRYYVYTASDQYIYVLDRRTHEVVWQTSPGGYLTIANGFLYSYQVNNVIRGYRAQEP